VNESGSEVLMKEKQPDENRMIVSMVALGAPSLPTVPEILESFASLSGKILDAKLVETKAGCLTLPLGGNRAGVALVPLPLPWSDLEGPCETAWWWPEAAARLQGHNSHLLVALSGGEGNAVLRSLSLTHLTAAVVANVRAAGIYWSSGGLIHNPQVFEDEARRASRQKLPLHLWIDFRVEPNEDGTLRLFTTGMRALQKMEIEIPKSRHTAKELVDFAYAIADYLLSRGAEIRDGHTVGHHENEKIMAAYAPSMLDKQMTVLQLDY
jgi:hypothetical protein